MQHLIENITILTAAPVINLGLLIDGILIGAIFALAAYGLALVWGVMNVKNLAQGDFIMTGGYIAWSLGRHGIQPLFGVPLAFVVLWGIGYVIYYLVVRKVITRDLFTSLLATFGIAICLQQTLNLIFGPDTQSAQADLPTWQFADGLISIAATRRVRTRAREMRQAPITMNTVRTSGNSSGSIDMPSAMPLSKASSQPPRQRP